MGFRVRVLDAHWGKATRKYFAAFNRQLRLDRGVPWNERRIRIAPEQYLADLAQFVLIRRYAMCDTRFRSNG